MAVAADITLPPFKGDLLRRALLWYLGSIWCQQPKRCRHGCQTPEMCLFGHLMEPKVDPGWSEPIRRLMGQDPPPAYVLWDEQDRRCALKAGDPFHYQLVLIGQETLQQVPSFIAAMMVAAERGMGRQHLKGRLGRVDALDGMDGHAQPLFVDDTWQGAPLAERAVCYTDGQAWVERVAPSINEPLHRLHLRFLSPIKLKMRGKWVRQPDFTALARAVVRRLRVLSEVHGGGPWSQADYGPLLDLAERVQLEHHETSWISRTRYSQRAGPMPSEGFVGQAWYASPADLRPLLPALWLGQWVHVGKGVVWGNGHYAIAAVE